MTRLVITVCVFSVGCFALSACDLGGEEEQAGDRETREEQPTTEPATTADSSTPTDLEEAGVPAISLTGDWLAAGAGAVWLSDPPGARIYRLDPDSGDTVATVRVPQGPCEATDVGFGALWTATCERPGLARIDPATDRVTGHARLSIPTEQDGEASVGAGAGAIWLVVGGPGCGSCRVAGVHPRSLKVVARIPVRDGSAAVRFGEGAVWVTNPARNLVQKIDPRRNHVVATTHVGPEARFFAVGEGGVWTLNQGDGSVTRLDPTTGAVTATIPAEVTGGGGDMTTGGGFVWARGSGYLLTRIDPRSNRVVERYGPSSGSGAVVVGFGAVWISAHDVGTVWRLPLDEL